VARYNVEDIDLDVDEIIDGLDDNEKQEMVDLLFEEGFEAENKNTKTIDPYSSSEHELSEIIFAIWNNRISLNNDDIDKLRFMSKKGFYQ